MNPYIPGFMPIPAVRDTNRLTANLDGSFDDVVHSIVSEDPDPIIRLFISDASRRILFEGAGLDVVKTVKDGYKIFSAVLDPEAFKLPFEICFLNIHVDGEALPQHSIKVPEVFFVEASDTTPVTRSEAVRILEILEAQRSGQLPIEEGADLVQVTGLELDALPKQIFITISRPSTTDRLAADVLIDTISKDGFTVSLSSPAPAAGYILNWRVEL